MACNRVCYALGYGCIIQKVLAEMLLGTDGVSFHDLRLRKLAANPMFDPRISNILPHSLFHQTQNRTIRHDLTAEFFDVLSLELRSVFAVVFF